MDRPFTIIVSLWAGCQQGERPGGHDLQVWNPRRHRWAKTTLIIESTWGLFCLPIHYVFCPDVLWNDLRFLFPVYLNITFFVPMRSKTSEQSLRFELKLPRVLFPVHPHIAFFVLMYSKIGEWRMHLELPGVLFPLLPNIAFFCPNALWYINFVYNEPYLLLGTVHAEIEVLSAENPELSVVLFYAWSRSESSFGCFTFCQESAFLVSVFAVHSTSFFTSSLEA